ncbi:MAG: hypothetical protein AVDCRST_MAG56-3165, partial [uncultured Cytophagales bacterium]
APHRQHTGNERLAAPADPGLGRLPGAAGRGAAPALFAVLRRAPVPQPGPARPRKERVRGNQLPRPVAQPGFSAENRAVVAGAARVRPFPGAGRAGHPRRHGLQRRAGRKQQLPDHRRRPVGVAGPVQPPFAPAGGGGAGRHHAASPRRHWVAVGFAVRPVGGLQPRAGSRGGPPRRATVVPGAARRPAVAPQSLPRGRRTGLEPLCGTGRRQPQPPRRVAAGGGKEPPARPVQIPRGPALAGIAAGRRVAQLAGDAAARRPPGQRRRVPRLRGDGGEPRPSHAAATVGGGLVPAGRRVHLVGGDGLQKLHLRLQLRRQCFFAPLRHRGPRGLRILAGLPVRPGRHQNPALRHTFNV